jgi:hypothetical protein
LGPSFGHSRSRRFRGLAIAAGATHCGQSAASSRVATESRTKAALAPRRWSWRWGMAS